jgi:hypothetical protein
MLIALNGADLFHSSWNTQWRVDATRHAGPVGNPIRALKNGINNNNHIRSCPPQKILNVIFFTRPMNGVPVGGIVKSWNIFFFFFGGVRAQVCYSAGDFNRFPASCAPLFSGLVWKKKMMRFVL